jgi:hypothetical protein
MSGVRIVSGLQHWRTIRSGGHFSASGMPNGTRVISPRAGRGRAAPVRDPGPLLMPLGDRVTSVPGSVSYLPQHGTGGSGGKPSRGIIVGVCRHIQQKTVRAPQQIKTGRPGRPGIV